MISPIQMAVSAGLGIFGRLVAGILGALFGGLLGGDTAADPTDAGPEGSTDEA